MSKKLKKPILTVAIPTYNRAKTLKRLLNQLKKESHSGFRILISDNASSDNTQEMVKLYQKKMKNVDYVRNEKNLRSWGNIYNLYKLSKTSYIWFLSDDEEILPRAINKIIESLHKYRPTVALFNHLKEDPYGRKVVDGVSQDTFFDDIKKLDNYGRITRAGFMSIIVMQKRLPLKKIKKKYIEGNYYIQMTLVILTLNDKFRFCEIAVPIVFRNTGYRSIEFFKIMITDFLRSILIVNHRFDNKKFIADVKKQTLKNLLVYLSQKLGLIRFYGKPDLPTIRMIIKYFGISSVIILSFPVIKFLMPAFMLKFAYKTKLQSIHGKKRGLIVYKRNINRESRFDRVSGHLS